MRVLTCTVCKEDRIETLFYKRKTSKTGRRHECSECSKERIRLYRENNREKDKLNQRKNRLKREYNITVEFYEELLNKQEGKCAICRNTETARQYSGKGKRGDISIKKLAIDHCHKTGQIRGLLCYNCNLGLGRFKDNTKSLEAAIQYLATFPVYLP